MTKSVSRLIEDLEGRLNRAISDLEWHSHKVAEYEESILDLRKSIDELQEVEKNVSHKTA